MDVKTDAKNSGHGGVLVPKQFMDLGPAVNDVEPSNSSTASPDRSASPPADVDVGSMSYNRHKNDGSNTTDQSSNPNKALKLNPTNQAQEATMRKARVSVRARSEAPMRGDHIGVRSVSDRHVGSHQKPKPFAVPKATYRLVRCSLPRRLSSIRLSASASVPAAALWPDTTPNVTGDGRHPVPTPKDPVGDAATLNS
ncbi:hypothetical protein B296_00004448 [Ensete ventricosum]|uniref:Uncharacterized protein n=1 Tax=Ensete ventricosum TaxID=4639 RepID=A0A427AAY6_ENSVE|nr:hypothetical protein B296_00004448 [Ensete ventricosum]